MVRPFCDASFLMQRDGNMMAHVLLVFFNLWKHLSGLGSEDKVDKMLSELKSRFKREEFHLLFLDFLVHVVFHQVAIKILDESDKNNSNYTDKKNCLSRARLLTASVFYYKKHKLHKEGATAKEKKQEEKILKTGFKNGRK